METKSIDLLVVEDNPRHLADARAYFTEVSSRAQVPVQVTYATNLAEALQHTGQKKFDGVLTDIFMPTGLEPATDKAEIERLYAMLIQIVKHCERDAARQWLNGNVPPPAGVAVVEKAESQGVPHVMVTDTYHHGASANPVCAWYREKRREIVDNRDDAPAGSPKRWQQAYTLLIQIIDAQRDGKQINYTYGWHHNDALKEMKPLLLKYGVVRPEEIKTQGGGEK